VAPELRWLHVVVVPTQSSTRIGAKYLILPSPATLPSEVKIEGLSDYIEVIAEIPPYVSGVRISPVYQGRSPA
jgi:hypothetical protein